MARKPKTPKMEDMARTTEAPQAPAPVLAPTPAPALANRADDHTDHN